MCQSENLLENLPSSMLVLPEDLKIEPAELPTSINTEVKIEPDLTIEAIPLTRSPSQIDNISNLPTSQGSSVEDLSFPQDAKPIEPLIKVRPACSLQYSPADLPIVNSVIPAPKILNQDMTNFLEKPKAEPWDLNPMEPADLSNKKPENLTCMPEIEYIKDETDNMSVYSNSSDPERLEVDMSQVRFFRIEYNIKKNVLKEPNILGMET